MIYSGWFVRYESNKDMITTMWEFGIDGLTEEQAIRLDRQFQALVADEIKS